MVGVINLEVPKYLASQGVSLTNLCEKNLPSRTQELELTNECILFLRQVITLKQLPWNHAVYWLENFLCLNPKEVPKSGSIQTQWNALHSQYRRLMMLKNNADSLKSFKQEEYFTPEPIIPATGKNVEKGICLENNSVTENIDTIVMSSLYNRLVAAYRELSEISSAMEDVVKENTELHNKKTEFEQMKKKFKAQSKEVNELKQKLATYNPRNVNRRNKRKQDQIHSLNQEIDRMTHEVNSLKLENEKKLIEIETLNSDLEEIAQAKKREQKMKSYYKNKQLNREINETENVKYLRDQVNDLNKVIDELQSQIDKNKKSKLTLFKDGKYSDEIRLVYMDLLKAGVSVENCQHVVKCVLKNLMEVDVDRLPQKSLASIIAVEAQIISQAQAADAMLQSQHNTLHLDGTKKRFKEYAGFQVSTEENNTLSLRLQLMPSGDADSYLFATKQTLLEMAEAVSSTDADKKETEDKLLMSIKNTMTDRHIVNKVYTRKLIEEKKKVCEDKPDLSEEEKIQLSSVNSLYCGLHILPNMATAAVKGLHNFETTLGVKRSSGYQTSNPVSYDLIHQVCKAFIVTTGDQKSGDALDFQDYLDEISEKSHLITFLHNRFNVIFHDGGAVFYHRKHINDYLTSGRCGKSNKLLHAVEDHIRNPFLLAQCRALGILGKTVCTPLWNLLEDKDSTYFSMNEHWAHLKEVTEMYSSPDLAKGLLKGESVFAGVPVKQDVVYHSLFDSEVDAEINNLTCRALACMMDCIDVMLERQLKDQLPGGNFHVPTESLLQETKSAPKTNRVSEADFSDLDGIEKVAPQKSTIVKSGMILFTKNKTSKYLQKLAKEKRDKYFEVARKIAVRRKRKDRIHNLAVQHLRLTKQHERLDAKIRREEKQHQYLQDLRQKMRQEGVWTTPEEVKKNVDRKALSEKKKLLKFQILFHTKVLHSKLPNKSLGKFQNNGKLHSAEKLEKNLVEIIRSNFATEVPKAVIDINNNVRIQNPSLKLKKVKKSKQAERKGKKRNAQPAHPKMKLQNSTNCLGRKVCIMQSPLLIDGILDWLARLQMRKLLNFTHVGVK